MELAKDFFYVHVSVENEVGYDVGPFDISGGCRFSDGAIDWIYKQIGILKSKFPESVLVKHRWNYKAKGAGVFGNEAVVDIKVELAGFTFEIVPLKTPTHTNVIEEQVDPASSFTKL